MENSEKEAEIKEGMIKEAKYDIGYYAKKLLEAKIKLELLTK